MRRTASRQDQPDDVDVEDSTDAGLLDVRYQVLVDRRSAADLTMLVSRIRIALRAGRPALGRRLPDPWDIDHDRSGVGQESNLVIVFYEVFLNQAAEGMQLTTADAVGRYFVVGVPSRHRETEETAFMVFRILTAHPTGENPFGWKGIAAGKITTHATIVRSQTLEARDLEVKVSDHVEARTNKGSIVLDLQYGRGIPERLTSEGSVRFATEPEHVRVYRSDGLVDVVKSVPAGIDRLERCVLRVILPELADIFDGLEQVVNITVQPWYVRQVYASSAGRTQRVGVGPQEITPRSSGTSAGGP
jgi:hypothetical protein